ncbi:GGDEF domain-containing protein [Roseateles cellulosilyticus]|uniref:diguanylate cyclase n=1 Tax=Pelomonas cellulosilytica TaxID=2906762 RepID=A0ABS8XZE3_9BURK|nr:GGDEF domain-containing protein [Pelomonas sp. P8]MCE4557227.1 GGDEF domain-containing protein [Pelomonas sp. P8]
MTETSDDLVLLRAQEALEQGDVEQATFLARQVLKLAQERRDRLYEGRALACLAHCDLQLSRLRRAHHNAQRAAHLLRESQDRGAEVMSLATLSSAAACLGHVDEAVESALLAVSLSEGLALEHLQPLAHNYLGVAFFWCQDFARAEAAFEHSADLVYACDGAAGPLQPLLNLAFLEASRFAALRFDTTLAPSVEKLRSRLLDCDDISGRHGDDTLMPGMTVAARTLVHVFNGLAAAWQGDMDTASAELMWCDGWEARYGRTTWLTAMRRWFEAEVAWACQDFTLAAALGREMIAAAAQAEHEALAGLGHIIVATMERCRGDSRAEADELRRLMQREQAIRVEALASRERAAERQLQARASAEHIVRLESRSRMLERLSLEDSLTGIPNRRALDRRLSSRKPGAGAADQTCVALIDVDRFKHINDNFSHHVGDRVLKVVADVLSGSVRAGDFVARLAGDEFVVLFGQATLADAQQICTRMKAAVQGYGWDGIAPGLAVSISVGLEQARAGESMQVLLQRSDNQMYVDKRRTRA